MDENCIPEEVRAVGFDFSWSAEKVWALDLPVQEMSVKELTWHLDLPFLDEGGKEYTLTPREVIEHPAAHAAEYERMLRAETNYPIEVMWNKERWVILDGLHRLMRIVCEGGETVRVRIVPREKVSDIVDDSGA